MHRGRPYAVDRMHVTPLDFEVPLDWKTASGSIRVHAKEVVAAEKRADDLPILCYFQGGPGFEPERPQSRSGWLKEVLERYRVVLLDERGTGQSAPLDAHALPVEGAEELARYLTHFRADSIVRDAEHVRSELLGNRRWTIMGHSYGGFCTVTYLSLFPEGLDGVINIGGLAPVLHGADDVYAALIERIVERNDRHFARFPEDAERVSRIVEHLASGTETDAHGHRLLPAQFLALGEWFGNQHGSAQLHAVIERAASDLDQLGRISYRASSNFGDVMHVTTNPVYAVLHEAIYAQGAATNWAAQRAIAGRPEFAHDRRPPYFTGEMIFPWMFEDVPALRPLRAAAEALAAFDAWPALFDIERLRSNDVPVVGALFWDDLYVHREYALETAALIGNCDVWLTNELEHRAPWEDPTKTMGRLFNMLDQKITPS